MAAIVMGLAIGFYSPLALSSNLLFIAGALVAAGAFFVPDKRFGITLMIMGLLLLGLGRGAAGSRELSHNIIQLRASPVGSAANISGYALDDTTARGRGGKFTLMAPALGQRVLVQTTSNVMVNAGDEVAVQGKVAQVDTNDQFDYERYLARQGVSQVVSARSVGAHRPAQASLRSALAGARQALGASLRAALPMPESDLVSGMVIGSQGNADQALLKDMNRTGTRHIVAVSGFNIALIGAVALELLFLFGASRRWATLLAIIVVVGYVALTGASASAVRAGIMGGIALFSLSRGIGTQSLHVLGVAASAMLMVTPSLFEDISFQLSFGAVLGIILLTPMFSQFLPRVLPAFLREVMVVSLGVQLMVAPLGAFHFGTLALFSLVYNALIVPLVPLVTIGGLAVGLVGLVSQPAAMILGIPISLVTSVMTYIIITGAGLPGTITLMSGSVSFLIVPYVIIGAIIYFWTKHTHALRTVRHQYV